MGCIEEGVGVRDYGYRWYDPLMGRWPSRDPIEESGGFNVYAFVENEGIRTIDFMGLCSSECIGSVKVKFFDSQQMEHANDKTVIGVLIKGYWPVSGLQFIGYMNVFDECGKLMEAFNVISGGHIEPTRLKGLNVPLSDQDTPLPSGKYNFDTSKNGLIGYLVNDVTGRGDIEIHAMGTTTGCIATQYFEEQLVPLVNRTRDNSCCKNRNKIPIEVWYEMKDGKAGPRRNRFRYGGDPSYRPENDNVVPPSIPPKAIIVPDPSNPSVKPWWQFW
jgi:RHS repeat-associated protein